MFEGCGARFGDLLLRGIDCALEFATLGEYRLAAPPATVRTGGTTPPKQRVSPLARAVMPATPAARLRLELATQAAARDRACEARSVSARRTRAVDAAPRGRTRGGAASPPPQPCLWASDG